MDLPRNPELPPEVARRRRAAAFAALGSDVMVLPAAPLRFASRDTDYAYRPDSELFYLTGAAEPGIVAVLVGGESPEWTLFVPPHDPHVALWSGERLDPEAATERFAPDACHPSDELEERLPELLSRGRRIHYRLGTDERVERLVRRSLDEHRTRGQRSGGGPRAVVDPGGILDELRLRKDAHEIELIRAAVAVTLEGHRAGAGAARPGVGEWEVEAAVEGTFRGAGARGAAFGTIVGSGPNACVLHYRDNRHRIPENGLVLVDAGADVALYAGDVTRTWPAGGRFTPEQRAVYDLVDAARAAGVARVGPGVRISEVHDASVAVLLDGLRDLGVLRGSRDELLESGAYRAYYPHQTSHWLGLDVHDPGDYACAGEPRRLEPGMVLTVEPGLYFRPGGEEAAARFEGIGIRVEDDVLVTESGGENLSAALPTDAEAVEALVRAHR